MFMFYMFEICVNQSCKPVQQELNQVEYGPKFSAYYEHKNLGLAVIFILLGLCVNNYAFNLTCHVMNIFLLSEITIGENHLFIFDSFLNYYFLKVVMLVILFCLEALPEG